jgi:hypothetical protein
MGSLVVRILLWFVPCVAGWYWLAPFADGVVASGARVLANLVVRDLVREVEVASGVVTFVTAMSAPAQAGVITVDANPRLFSYGFALFAAIVLGARARSAWWGLPLGIGVVALVAMWGVAFDLLAHLVRSAPAALAARGVTQGTVNAIALGYQLGSLVLPAVVPAVVAVAVAWKEISPPATDPVTTANTPVTPATPSVTPANAGAQAGFPPTRE